MHKIFNIKFTKYCLQNGLEVILYPDNSLPLVTVNLWYKVGSANEVIGKTGFAHLFEHMMFQGSENVPKEKHFKFIQEAGGTLNGSTSLDRTNYYQTVPSNHLEMVLWLESDRMGFMLPGLTQEKLDNQKDVVLNERLQNYDNQPYGLAWEKIFSNLFPETHPYHWPTIGWQDDIKSYKLEEVKDFFKLYYSPNNASLVIGGDINIEQTKKLVDKYFAGIPGNIEVPEIKVPQFSVKGVKTIIYEDDVQLEKIYFAFRTAPVFHEDEAALDLLGDILSGAKNSRLYKKLLFEKQIAQDVSTFQYSAKQEGMFFIVATAKPGESLEEIKAIIFDELKGLISHGITDEELNRSKTGTRSHFIYSLQNLNTLVNQINNYNCNLGNPNSFQFELDRYANVTGSQICEAAKKYLDTNYIELKIIPKK